MKKVDVIVVGAGPGGYRAAELAARAGLQVVVFEEDEVGGTCLNVGCIPTKVYVHSASFDEARQRMATVVPQLRAGVEAVLSHPNITLVREHADLSADDLRRHTLGGYVADNIIIATGSKTKYLPLPDIGDPRLVDSTGLLALDTLPRRLCIIGAGVIGMEFASAFQRFGSEVMVVEYLKECLPVLDGDIARRLRKLLEKRGIAFRMKTAVQQLADIDADIILMATGRVPRMTAVAVDENFETADKGVYVIGDANGRQMLAHAAEMQAQRVVNHITGKADGIRFDIMPAAIFTTPEAACVGVADGPCRKAFWRANGKAQAMGESEGMLKLFYAETDGRITGCHAFGAHAADIVQEVSVLMCRDTTVGQLADMVHIHPTLSEILRQAAEQ